MSISIFSRKSKSAQTQGVNGRVNGHTTASNGLKNGAANGKPDGPPVDPILQRMALQAASRKRMNSHTPDYSIRSASSSPGHPPANFNTHPYPPPPGQRPRGDAPIETISPSKGPRETNKLRKSSANMAPPTPQASFPRVVDPDMQKVRMPPSQQISRDSGYASVAPSSTVISRTQPNANAPTDSELLMRHRQINAAQTRNDGEARTMTAAVTPIVPPPTTWDMKARTAPTTPTKTPLDPTEDKPYVSRLDPGPASSGFLTSSVVPEISKPRPDALERIGSTPPQVVSTSPPSKTSMDNAAAKRLEPGAKPMPNMSLPRESQPPKQESLTNTAKRTSGSPQSKRTDAVRAAPPTSPVPARSTVVQRTKDQEKTGTTRGSGYISPNAALESQYPNTQRLSTSTASYQTTRETPELPATVPQLRGLPADDPESAPQPLASPKDEFPYLAGIAKGPTMPPVSVLEGFKVNRRGQILDEEGDIIGELVSGEIVQCVRRTVNDKGEVLDDSGNVIGQAVAVARRTAEDDTPRSNFANELVSPISPVGLPPPDIREITTTLSKPTRYSQRANSVPERTLNNADSEGNVVYIELDASADSQAGPLVDQSEIFIPPYAGSQSQARSKSATNLAEIKRIAEGRRSMQASHSPSASQGKNSIEERVERRGSKWVTRYFDSRTGEEMPRTGLNSEATGEGAKEQERPRSYSLMTNTAPKAVLGPTWESLLDTVPDRAQSFAQHKSVIVDGKLASQSSFRSSGPARADTMPSMAGNGGNVNMSSGSTAGRSRRASQNAPNARNSTHQPFAKSPLSSIANTPPDTAAGEGSDTSFQRQLAAPGPGLMQASASQAQVTQPIEDDDSAAPAPIIKKKAAGSIKSRKRKSIFGIPFGRSKQSVAAN